MERIFEFLNVVIFKVGETYEFTLLNLLYTIVVLVAAIFVLRKQKQLIARLGEQFEIGEKEQGLINRVLRTLLVIITVVLLFQSVGFFLSGEQVADFWNFLIFRFIGYNFRVKNLVGITIVLVAANFVFSKYKLLIAQLTGRFEIEENEQKTINRAFRIILFWLTVVMFFQSAGFELETITDYSLHSYDCKTVDVPEGQWKYNYYEIDTITKVQKSLSKETYDNLIAANTTADNKIYKQKVIENSKTREECSHFRLSNIINSIIIFFFFKIIIWTIIQLLSAYYKREKMDKGSQYAINRLIKYFVYTVMVLTIIETLGFQLTVVWGAAGALLVGFGLGLQQTFNDLFSGVLIMIEGSVHVGDMVRVKGEIGKVTKIGIRASEVRMRDDVELIVPNSHLVMDGLANWNHSDQKARFFVSVGVAYGSDTELVKKLLLSVAARQSKIIDYPEPMVRFADFGNSSLDFELHFWTFDVFGVLDIQSDLRFEIDKAFREHNIEIPFPQRDLWVRNAKDLK